VNPIRPYVLTIREFDSYGGCTVRRYRMPAYDAADAQAQWKCTRFSQPERPKDDPEPLELLLRCEPLDPENPEHEDLPLWR